MPHFGAKVGRFSQFGAKIGDFLPFLASVLAGRPETCPVFGKNGSKWVIFGPFLPVRAETGPLLAHFLAKNGVNFLWPGLGSEFGGQKWAKLVRETVWFGHSFQETESPSARSGPDPDLDLFPGVPKSPFDFGQGVWGSKRGQIRKGKGGDLGVLFLKVRPQTPKWSRPRILDLLPVCEIRPHFWEGARQIRGANPLWGLGPYFLG